MLKKGQTTLEREKMEQQMEGVNSKSEYVLHSRVTIHLKGLWLWTICAGSYENGKKQGAAEGKHSLLTSASCTICCLTEETECNLW